MATSIAHLSDLHFGRESTAVVEGLLTDLDGLSPDLVVVSGDLTERARPTQFRMARRFLNRLRVPWIATPGNHDVPLFPLHERLRRPAERFARHIDPAPVPSRQAGRIWAASLCTAHGRTWKSGRISREMLETVCALAVRAPNAMRRMIVAHHPFRPPPDDPKYRLVSGCANGLRRLSAAGVDMVLGGHVHRAYALDAAESLGLPRPLIVMQAPTAVSLHLRDRPNGYNLLMLDDSSVEVATRYWAGREFVQEASQRFLLDGAVP